MFVSRHGGLFQNILNQPGAVRGNMSEKVKKDRDWSSYPVGTKAWAIMGGYWEKVSGPPDGWKWCTGDTFPGPGADTTGYVTLPDQAQNDPHEKLVREIAEILAKAHNPIAYSWYKASLKRYSECIDQEMGVARAMVEKMADAFEEAYFLSYPHDKTDPAFKVWHEQCDIVRAERGLIPSPTKTGEL